MADVFALTGPAFGPLAGAKARQLVVLLHGIGADGNDLIGLAPHLARYLPEAEFLSPHAPYPYEAAPFGRQWFSLMDRTPAMMLAGVRAAAPILDGFLDAELEKRGLSDGRLACVGFSQGAAMALHVALRRAEPCAALVGYSGAMLGSESFGPEVRARPPVLLVHGDADEVVPVALHAAAVAALRSAHVPVTARIREGLGHGIDDEGLKLGADFLRSAFGVARAGAD